MTTIRSARAERVYDFICSYIKETNTVPEIADIITACVLSRPLVDRAIQDLQEMGYLLDGSLLPTAHFPDVPI